MRIVWAGKLVGVAVSGAIAVMVTNGVAAADQPSELNRARAIMELGYEQFAEVVRSAPFDWSTDGCSSPVVADPYPKTFGPACKIHDFGYRNFGGHGLRLSADESTRKWIDDRFMDEMNRICKTKSGLMNRNGESPRSECVGAAQVYYSAVRREGGKYFF